MKGSGAERPPPGAPVGLVVLPPAALCPLPMAAAALPPVQSSQVHLDVRVHAECACSDSCRRGRGQRLGQAGPGAWLWVLSAFRTKGRFLRCPNPRGHPRADMADS